MANENGEQPPVPTTTSGGSGSANSQYDEAQIVQWIVELRDPNKRENALLELR